MGIVNLDKVVYQLTVEDLQHVAEECIERELTESEIKLLEEIIGDHIDWFGTIQNAIIQNIKE